MDLPAKLWGQDFRQRLHGDTPQWAWNTGHGAKEDYSWVLRSSRICLAKFWTSLGPVTHFFLLTSLFWNGKVIAYGEQCKIRNLQRFSFGTRFQTWAFKSFCIAEFYGSEKGTKKASGMDIKRGMESAPLASPIKALYTFMRPTPTTYNLINKLGTNNRKALPDPNISLKIARSLRRFLLRRNMSLSKTHCYTD